MRNLGLIDNPPENRDSLNTLTYEFLEKNHKMCQLVDSTNYYRSYAISFYKKTPCTEYFIENENDYTGMFQTTIKQCENGLYIYIYERDSLNPNQWIMNYTKEIDGYDFHDTISCEKKKIVK